jgi:hypothetical protein
MCKLPGMWLVVKKSASAAHGRVCICKRTVQSVPKLSRRKCDDAGVCAARHSGLLLKTAAWLLVGHKVTAGCCA